MKLKIIPGTFNSLNYHSSDLGWQGLLAYGNNCYVQIIDPKSGQFVQTLEKHSSIVHLVKWAPCSFYHDLKKPYSLKLASADVGGTIVVWEAAFSTILADFNCNKKVLDFQWLKNQEVAIDFVLALHSGGELILWNTDSGNKVWIKTFSDSLLDFSLDFHDSTNAVFRGENFLLLVSGISLLKPPDGSGQKYFICGPEEVSPSVEQKPLTEGKSSGVMARSAKILKATTKLVMDLGSGSANEFLQRGSAGSNTTSHLQVLYHGYCQNHIIIVYPREILVMDLMIFQAVAAVQLDKNVANFSRVYSCWQNDILYCLHENGVVSVRGRRPMIVSDEDSANNAGMQSPVVLSSRRVSANKESLIIAKPWWVEAGPYQLLSQTEPPRLSKNIRLVSMSVSPALETFLAIISSDTKVQTWEMRTSPVYLQRIPAENSFLLSPLNYVKIPRNRTFVTSSYSQLMLLELISPLIDYSEFQCNSELEKVLSSYKQISSAKAKMFESEKSGLEKWAKVSMILTSLYQGVLSEPTVVSANPLNINESDWPMVVVGNAKGFIQVWNLKTSQIERELQVIHAPILGIEWLLPGYNSEEQGRLLLYGRSGGDDAFGFGLNYSLSFGMGGSDSTGYGGSTSLTGMDDVHSPLISGTVSGGVKVKNFMCMVQLATGRTVDLRGDALESPIDVIRISQHKQYFTVLLRTGTIEIWDSRRLYKLRELTPEGKPVNILEWSLQRSQPILSDNLANENNSDSNEGIVYWREKFLTIDTSGMMQNIVVDGSKIVKGKRVPVESLLNKVCALAYWNNVVILGDLDGNLLFWNFKTSRSLSGIVGGGGGGSNQNRVLRIKLVNIRSGNMSSKLAAILTPETVSVWNWNEGTMLRMFRYARDKSLTRVIDIEWLDDGITLVMLTPTELDVVRAASLERTTSPVGLADFPNSISCLRMLSPKVCAALKCLLQHQPWRSSYSLDFECWRDNNDFGVIFEDKLYNVLTEMRQTGQLDRLNESVTDNHDDSNNNAAFLLAYRCFGTALILGDEYECRFWLTLLCTYFPDKEPGRSAMWESIFVPFSVFKAAQRARLLSLERKRSTLKQAQKCAEAFIMLGDLDKAVRLLLETPASNPSYVADLQLACLLSNQATSSAEHHSTVKLVATQFLANNCLREGVQLLCAIGKQQDACRYLETYLDWKTALWLAKCTLSEKDVKDIERRWINYLLQSQSGQRSIAILQLIQLKDWCRLIELLLNVHQYQLAMRFMEFCLLLMPQNETTETDFIPIDLKKKVVLEFGHLLDSIGLKKLSNYYHSTFEIDSKIDDESQQKFV